MSIQQAAGLAQAGAPLRSAHLPDDVLVLAGRALRPGCGPGPRFGDDVWDLSAARAAVNCKRTMLVVRFGTITDPVWRLTAKEYAYARLTHPVEGSVKQPSPLTLIREISVLRDLFRHLHEHQPGLRLADIRDDEILDGFLDGRSVSARWQAHDRARHAWALNLLHGLSDHLTHDRLIHIPWRGQTAGQIAGRRAQTENATPRIPPHVLGSYVRGALFHVQTAAPDILAASAELARLGPRPRAADEGPGHTRARLTAFIDDRQAQGRGLPATSPWANDPGQHGTGVNLDLLARLIGSPRQTLKTPGILDL